jgi:programmed cell death 6-interacting protein
MLSLPLQSANVMYSAGFREDSLRKITGVTGEDVVQLIELRKHALENNPHKETNLSNLTHYAQTLQAVIPRLEGYEADCKFEFNWSQAFNSKNLASGSLHFELSSILWNLAALYSNLAIKQDRKTVEGLKSACKYYCAATGTLTHIKDTVASRIKGGVHPHLTDVGLQFAINLMLAQAQAMFYLKAVNDRDHGLTSITTSIIAKIAAQVSLFYARSYSFSRQVLCIDIPTYVHSYNIME